MPGRATRSRPSRRRVPHASHARGQHWTGPPPCSATVIDVTLFGTHGIASTLGLVLRTGRTPATLGSRLLSRCPLRRGGALRGCLPLTASSHRMSGSRQLLKVLRAEIELHVPLADPEAQGFCRRQSIAAITDQDDSFHWTGPFVEWMHHASRPASMSQWSNKITPSKVTWLLRGRTIPRCDATASAATGRSKRFRRVRKLPESSACSL